MRRPALVLGLGYVVLGFVLVGALIVATGATLDQALSGWFLGAFGSGYSIVQTLSNAAPLALVAVGVAIALRAEVITVGAEGQMVAGAILATIVSLALGESLPALIALPIGALAGVLGGVLWALPPALAKVRWNVNEILSTLLANYLAVFLLAFLLRTVLRDPGGSATPRSAELPLALQLPQLPLPGRLHVGAVVILVIVLLAFWWSRSRSAFLVDVVGQRPVLAARLGLTPAYAVLGTMLVSGATAGLAGWMQLSGVLQRLAPDVAGGVGFAGLAVAVLGRGNPLGILLAAIVYASLGTGADGVEIATGTTPASIGTVGQGVLLLAAALALGAAKLFPTRVARKAKV